jgi:hypothetical protein
MLEFLHQYFIGISKLTCSKDNCPLVLNWGTLESKNSYQGKSALVKITAKDFAPVDLIAYQENDLGGYSDIEVKFKSGKGQRTKPSYEEPEEAKVSGYDHQPKPPKEIFLKDSEVVLFFNNSSKTANLEEAESIYLNDLWDLKEKIK